MRKGSLRSFIWSGGLSAALACASTPAAAEEYPATNLKVQGGWATGGIYTEYEVPFWEEHIPELSDGQVTANLTNLNEMGLKGPEVFRLLKLGVIDIGTSVLGYVAGDHPENGAADLAGVALNVETAREAVEAWAPVLNELYENTYAVKPIIFYPAEAQAIFCNKEIKSIDDFKGKKIRVHNRSIADFVEALGATSITMSFGEVVPALQRNVIDCAVTGTFSGNSAKWYEVATHLFPLPLGWSVFMYAASQQSWAGLDPKVRSLLSRELEKLEDELWEAGAYRTQQGIECNIGSEKCEKGTKAAMELVPITDEDKRRHAEIVEDTVLARWAERCGAECAERWNETVGEVVGMAAAIPEE